MATQSDMIQEFHDSRKYRLRWWTLMVLSLSLLVIVVDTVIVNVAIPTLQLELDASAAELQWIVDAYILVLAGLLLIMGSVIDRFGRKKGMQAGLVVLGLSSFFAAYAQNNGQLISARAIMGVGAAMIMPSTLSIIVDVFPRRERTKAIGIWAGIAAISVPLGLLVGGALLDHFWWGSVFLFNVPVVAIALGAGAFLVPESRHPTPPKIDPIGAVLSVSVLSILIYAIIEAPGRGWLDPLVIGAFAITIGLGGIFVIYELRSKNPMLDMRLFSNLRLSSSAAATALGSLAFVGFLFIMTQYFQFVRGYTPFETGLAIIPLVLGFFIGTANAHRVIGMLGIKQVAGGGLAVIAAALIGISFLEVTTAYWVIGVGFVILGIGLSNLFVSSTDIIMGSVPEANAGLGSAVSNLTRQAGGALGVAILGSLVTSIYSTKTATAATELPAGLAAAVRDNIGAATQIAAEIGGSSGDALKNTANAAFVEASGFGMLAGAGIAFLGALVLLRFMPARE